MNGQSGTEIFATTKQLARLILACALLALGSWAAQAGPPVLTLPGTITVAEDGATNVAFSVTDSAVPIFTVTTIASSSNTNLVSDSSLVISGFGTNRALAIKPALHQSGTATITVIASDSQPASVTNTFTVNVTFTNYPPVFLAPIANHTINENASAVILPFVASDIETPASNLVVTATSSNTTLVPNTNLVIGGADTNFTLTLTPATNQNGTTLIEIIVTDGGGATVTNDFILTVWPVNQPPTFTMMTNVLTYHEYFGPVTIPNFITGVSSGPPNQSSESNYFTYLYTTNFFTQAPAVDANGTLTFQVVNAQAGTNTITFILNTTGPTTNGGQNSLTKTLTLQVPTVLEPPSFTLATNFVAVTEESPPVTNRNS